MSWVYEPLIRASRVFAIRFGMRGKMNRNTDPCATSLVSAYNRPPCSCTIEREIERPMPIPLDFVV
jgi:hypothetical protein